MNPRKNVIQITEDELPEPFKNLWFCTENNYAKNIWSFYLVDGELYLSCSEHSRLIRHWSQSGSRLAIDFIKENKLALPHFPLVTKDGEYLFQLLEAPYQLLAVFEDGSTEIVYDG
jgi:hypothetical protein